MIDCPIADRLGIEDLAVAYAYAVDAIGDSDEVANLFTEDGVYDVSGFGLGEFAGRAAIRTFFDGAFEAMASNAHLLSNFRLTAYRGETATAEAYMHAFSLSKDGKLLDLKALYRFDVARTSDGWKIARFSMRLLIPPA